MRSPSRNNTLPVPGTPGAGAACLAIGKASNLRALIHIYIYIYIYGVVVEEEPVTGSGFRVQGSGTLINVKQDLAFRV